MIFALFIGLFFFFFSQSSSLFLTPLLLPYSILNTTSTALLTLNTKQCLLHIPVQPTKVTPRGGGGTCFARDRFSKATHKQDTVSASHQPKSGSGNLGSFMELQFPDGHWLKFGITCFHSLPLLVFGSILFGGLP